MKPMALFAAAIAASSVAIGDQAAAEGMPAAAPAAAHHAPVKKAAYRARYVYGHHYVRGPSPGGPDPYAYSYERAGYYPYYNSSYWVPRKQMVGRTRYPLRIPEYGSSWGYPLACKTQGGRSCGVPFVSPAGHPAHAYNREEQLRLSGGPRQGH